MASSGSFNTSQYGNRGLTFNWWINSQSIGNNSTEIGWNLVGNGSQSGFYKAGAFYLSIDGVERYKSSGRIELWNGTVVASGTCTIGHNSDGNKSFGAYAEAGVYSFAVNVSGSGSWSLTTIPRYANFTNHYVSSTSLNSISVYWSADASCDAVQYSLNGGAWTDISGYPIYTIGGLADGTQYNIRTRIKRTDSQLWTESGYIYGATLPRASISSGTPNISNGNSLRVTTNNSSGKSCRIRLETIDNGVTTNRYTKNGTDVTFSVEEINALMSYFPNNATFTIRVVADTMDGNTCLYNSWKDGTYTIVNSNPVFSNFTYADIDTSIVTITGNNQYIVKNKSNLKVTISKANKMIAQNSATSVRYEITCSNRSGSVNYSNGNDVSVTLGTITSAGTTNIIVKAYDSRGFYTSKTLTINVIDYNEVIQANQMYRINNFENDTKLKIKGTFSLVQCGGVTKNTIKRIRYRYKEDGGSFGNYVTATPTIISNGYECNLIILNLDNTKSYIAEVGITDTFGIEQANQLIVNEGIPIMFVNSTKKNVGVGLVNEHEEYSLAVAGKIYLSSGNEVLDYDVVDTW